MEVIEEVTGGTVSDDRLGVLDLQIPSTLQLPLMYLLSETIQSLQVQKQKDRYLKVDHFKAEISAKVKIFSASKKFTQVEVIVNGWLVEHFTPIGSATETGSNEGGLGSDRSATLRAVPCTSSQAARRPGQAEPVQPAAGEHVQVRSLPTSQGGGGGQRQHLQPEGGRDPQPGGLQRDSHPATHSDRGLRSDKDRSDDLLLVHQQEHRADAAGGQGGRAEEGEGGDPQPQSGHVIGPSGGGPHERDQRGKHGAEDAD